MLTQEILGATDFNTRWPLPAFTADQLDTKKWKYRWRWVGAGGGTSAINDEQMANEQYQEDLARACRTEFYVNGVLTKSVSDASKELCQDSSTGTPTPTPPPATPPSFYQQHKTAVLVGGGALAAVAVAGAVLLVRRKK
jgi:hypothetical protein